MDSPRPLGTPSSSPVAPDSPAADSGTRDSDWLDRMISLTLDVDPAGTPPGSDQQAGGNAPSVQTLPIERLIPSPFPVRHAADPDRTAQLAASIAEHGILQPILVRPHGIKYEIVAGMRRYEAAKLIGLPVVPVIALALSAREALMVSLVENLQRDDITALDEAHCYLRLLGEFGWTQDELARHLGRSRSHIANTLRLIDLPPHVKSLLESGSLSAGHARALLTAEDPAALAESVVGDGLTVRQTEALVRGELAGAATARSLSSRSLGPFETSLAEALGLKLSVRPLRDGGKITIYFHSIDELENALRQHYGKISNVRNLV